MPGDSAVRVSQDLRRDFWIHAQVEQYGCKSSPPTGPALPDFWNYRASCEVIQVEREALFFPSENPNADRRAKVSYRLLHPNAAAES